jgi:deoxyribodipyrimidine photo-lyase
VQLCWHRRTLRPRPNPALSTAFTAAERTDSCVVPVFVLDERILSRADGLGVAFMLGSLRALRDWYRGHGGDIVVRNGDPTDVVRRVARATDVERVVWNEDRSRLARQRDRAVTRALARADVAHTAVPCDRSTEANSASPLPPDPGAHLADPRELDIPTEPVPRLADLDAAEYDSAPLDVGTESARKQLRALSNGSTYRRCDDGGDGLREPRAE